MACRSNCTKRPMVKMTGVIHMKMKELGDCYNCQVSEAEVNRRRTREDRWDYFFENFPRMPNRKGNDNSCETLAAIGKDEFKKFDTYQDREVGLRQRDRERELYRKNLRAVTRHEMLMQKPEPIDSWVEFAAEGTSASSLNPDQSFSQYLDNRDSFERDEQYTIWKDKLSDSKFRYQLTEGVTKFNNMNYPFGKNEFFTAPVVKIERTNYSKRLL